jgi:hypothetical protein
MVTVQQQTLDSYGNVKTYKVTSGGNSREWSYSYLQDLIEPVYFAPYKARYIVDRLTEHRMVFPENKALRTIMWDTPNLFPGSCGYCEALPAGPYPAALWESQTAGGCYFGLAASVTVDGVTTQFQRYVTGVAKSATSLGRTVTATADWRGQLCGAVGH